MGSSFHFYLALDENEIKKDKIKSMTPINGRGGDEDGMVH